jgi:hypothetical protein
MVRKPEIEGEWQGGSRDMDYKCICGRTHHLSVKVCVKPIGIKYFDDTKVTMEVFEREPIKWVLGKEETLFEKFKSWVKSSIR